MPKMLQRQAKDILAVVNNVPAPTQADIDRAKVAAMTCNTTKEFCAFLEMEPLVFKLWCNKYPSYNKAVIAWRDRATSEIEVAMAKRAVGFTKRTRKDIITRAGTIETLTTETYYPPDPTAAQFWLKNRAPQDWQDKKEVDINVTANIRQWLIEAGGMDQSEIIDITPNVGNEVIAQALALTDDGTSEREATMLAEVEASVEANVEDALNTDTNTQDAPLNVDTNNDPLSALNIKWR